MASFIKKLLVYGFYETLENWIFIFKETAGNDPLSKLLLLATVFFPLMLLIGLLLDLPFAVKRTIRAIREDVWKIDERDFGLYLFKVP